MPEPLEQLVYVSAATEPQTFGALNAIRREAAANNLVTGMTGLLVAGGGRYVQALEGNPVFLEQLLHRIERDTRHDSVQVVDRVTIDRRRFKTWALAAHVVCEPLDHHFQALLEPFGNRIRRKRIIERFARFEPDDPRQNVLTPGNASGNFHPHTRVPSPNGEQHN